MNGIASRKKNILFGIEPVILLCGTGGTILKSSDGGENWAARASGVTRNINDIMFIGDTPIALAVGSNGLLLLSIDSGDSWIKHPNSPLTDSATQHLLGIAYANPFHRKGGFRRKSLI